MADINELKIGRLCVQCNEIIEDADLDAHIAANPTHWYTEVEYLTGQNTDNIDAVVNEQNIIDPALLGAVNGVAQLDANGHVPQSQLSPTNKPEVYVVADAAARTALTVQQGDEAIQTDDDSQWVYTASGWYERPTATMAEQIYGTQFQYAESLSLSVTTEDEEEDAPTKLTMVTGSLPAGTYKLELAYGWSADTTSEDFHCWLERNNNQVQEEHRQEPKDSGGSWGSAGTNQRHYVKRVFWFASLSGVQTFKVKWMSDDDDDQASIWDCSMNIIRVA